MGRHSTRAVPADMNITVEVNDLSDWPTRWAVLAAVRDLDPCIVQFVQADEPIRRYV